MWYILTHRISYHETQSMLVYLRTREDVLPLMDMLNIRAANMTHVTD